MLKKVLQTNPRDANRAGPPRSMAEGREKCTLPFVLPAEAKQEFLFSPEMIVLCTAATVSREKDNF